MRITRGLSWIRGKMGVKEGLFEEVILSLKTEELGVSLEKIWKEWIKERDMYVNFGSKKKNALWVWETERRLTLELSDLTPCGSGWEWRGSSRNRLWSEGPPSSPGQPTEDTAVSREFQRELKRRVTKICVFQRSDSSGGGIFPHLYSRKQNKIHFS